MRRPFIMPNLNYDPNNPDTYMADIIDIDCTDSEMELLFEKAEALTGNKLTDKEKRAVIKEINSYKVSK